MTVNTENLRPRYHLSPRRHWMNDPNGLVHHDGRWHAFFQHNPEGNDWGNMSWGHASSPDLVHWTEHPVALRHRDGEVVFSGSVVVDGDSLAALHTSVYADGRQAQSLARSTDGGLTWTAYAGNPVLDRGSREFRDPKVFRHAGRWVMVAVEATERQVLLHESDDLVTWRLLSTFEDPRDEGPWECPDLVELPVEGQPGRSAWVLVVSVQTGSAAGGSGTRYLVGDFDGTTFTPHDRRTRWLDHGRDNYAGVTFDQAPDGRRVLLAWMSSWDYAGAVPTSPWRGGMTLPRELTLQEHDGELALVPRPVPELDALADGPPVVVDVPGDGPHGRRELPGTSA
jgi:sucrose-6-phosphate hydrolase SacC (GH32 family)